MALLLAGCGPTSKPPAPRDQATSQAQNEVQARAAGLLMDGNGTVSILGGVQELVAVVKDAQGQPLAGAQVDWVIQGAAAVEASLLDETGAKVGDHRAVVTDDQGRAVQKIQAEKPGPVQVYAVLQPGAGKTPLLANTASTWVNARVEVPAQAQASSDGDARLSTRVLRGDGKPLPGYRVHWFVDDPASGQFRESGSAQASSVTDSLGVARIHLQPAAKDSAAARVNVAVEQPGREACQCSQVPTALMAAGQTQLVWQTAEPQPVSEPEPEKAPVVVAREPVKPHLELAMACPQAVDLGDRVEYELTLTNRGPGQARDVQVLDQLPPALRHDSGDAELVWRVPKLNPGKSTTARVWTRAVVAGEFENKAQVQGGKPMASCPILVRQGALNMVKQGPAERFLGQTSRYQIQVRNAGDGTAKQVVVGDAYPAGMRFLSAEPAGKHDAEKRQVTWALGDLPGGESRDIQVAFKSERIGRLCDKGQAMAEWGLEAQAVACTEVKGLVALLLEVVDGPDPVVLGTQTTYSIRVVNQGSAPATGVTVLSTLPAELAFVEAGGPTTAVVDGREIRFAPLASLAPGEKVVYQVKVKALKEGDVRFATEITANELSSPVGETESTRLYE